MPRISAPIRNCESSVTQAAFLFVVRTSLLLGGTLLAATGVALTGCAQDCSDVARGYRSSVVSIEVKKTAKDTGAVSTQHGTGFIIDQEGHVLTSRSLFSKDIQDGDIDPPKIRGGIGSQKAPTEPMEYLTSSVVGDVAVLMFSDTSQKRNAIALGDPWSIQNGDSVCYMGFPLDIEFLLKPGTVTGKGATRGWWYSDIAYNPGVGGAPVFDSRNGKLIGIVGVSAGDQAETRGVGYIVPINLAYPYLLQFANIEIKRDAAQTLASGLQGLQSTPPGTSAPLNTATLSGTQLQDRGRSILASIWPTAQVPVCWENPSPAVQHEMSVVEQEIAGSWQKESQLRFTGWEKCATENRGLRILIDDGPPHTTAIGRQLDGTPNGIVLDLTFEQYATECKRTRDFCIRAYAGHEFGHAIGFGHTHTRPDAPADCKRKIGGSGNVPPEQPDVSWQLTPYDPDSIMNYCNPKFYNDGNLSELDIQAVRMLYGAPVKADSSSR